MQEQDRQAGPAIRLHARVACDDVQAGVKIEGTEEWIQVGVGDLSLGGAFLVTERFIVEGTQIDVGLAFPSGIRLFFGAEVARAMSASAKGPAGLGVQFLSTTSENTNALSRELEPRMRAAALEAPLLISGQPVEPSAPAPAGGSAPPSGGVLELTTTIYERLRLPPECDDSALTDGLERLIASVEQSLEQIPPGRQKDQAAVFKQTLERMRPLCQDPIKRAAYDFHNGIVRAEERIAAAAAGRGPSLVKLQEAWKRIFSSEVREGKRLFMEARRGAPEAAAMLEQARRLDPFNAQYRQAMTTQPPMAPAPAVAPSPFGVPAATPMAAAATASPEVTPPLVAAVPVEAATPAEQEPPLELLDPDEVVELPEAAPDDFFDALDE